MLTGSDLHSVISMVVVMAGAMAIVLYGRSARLKWMVIAVYVAAAGRYLYWRAAHTLIIGIHDPVTTFASIAVFAAELYGLLNFLLFCYQAYAPTDRTSPPVPAPPAAELPTVDVFVTTYNEPVDLAYRTLVACSHLDYPADRLSIHLLDDGNRPEMRRMAERLGCRYLAREDNRFAKAGNLNNALPQSAGELILVLDVDHVPTRTFLRETVGFFGDKQVACVQTPHHFYNPDVFQRNLSSDRELNNEQELFFRVIQPGRDRHNAAFFAGSAGIFRRETLMDIGGFQTATITEDLHTSMVLHARGYRSVYYNRVLTAGLTPETFADFLKQRQRWAEGGAYLLTRSNPLLFRGLTLSQRINYFASMFYFLHAFPRVVYLTAPLYFLLFGIAPIRASLTDMSHYYISFYALALITFSVMSNGRRRPFWSDVYETATCTRISLAVFRGVFKGILKDPEQRFVVTPKALKFDRVRYDFGVAWFPITMAAGLVVGIIAGLDKLGGGTMPPGGFTISLIWAFYNLLLCINAIAVSRDRPQRRTAPRLVRPLKCRLGWDQGLYDVGVRDVSESGLALASSRPIPAGTAVEIELAGRDEVTLLAGVVMRNRELTDACYDIGVQFADVSEEMRQSLVRQIFGSPEHWSMDQLPSNGVFSSFLLLLTSPFRAFGLWRRKPRAAGMENVPGRTSEGVSTQPHHF